MKFPNKNNKKRSGGFMTGAIFGTLLGGIAALLLAPKSGKETQKDLKTKAKKIAKDAESRLNEVENELGGRIDNLKVAARDLRGEAYEESQQLISKAELLKADLQDSASRLAKSGKDVGKDASSDAKRLVSEGQSVIDELERTTKRIMGSARDKAGRKNGKK